MQNQESNLSVIREVGRLAETEECQWVLYGHLATWVDDGVISSVWDGDGCAVPEAFVDYVLDAAFEVLLQTKKTGKSGIVEGMAIL